MTDAQPPLPKPDPTEHHYRRARYQIAHTLCSLLPPPLADTPEALLIRD